MKTDAARTWPIARREVGAFAWLGLPQRLGDGGLPTRETYDVFPPLEAVAGQDWLARVLAVLLPRTLTWAWWATSRPSGLERLSPGAMPAVVPLRSLDRVLTRSWFWRGVTLAIVPPSRPDAQGSVIDGAGVDTEHTPEFVLTAPVETATWDSGAISEWCRDRSAWAAPDSFSSLPAERAIVLFDGDVYCGLAAGSAPAVLRAVEELAATWSLDVIPGPAELAWPTQGGERR
jgi:hypothetical protein